jgi:hypothetical protein
MFVALFALEPLNDEMLGGFFVIEKLGSPGRWACMDSGWDCSGGAFRVAIAWVASALAKKSNCRMLSLDPLFEGRTICRITLKG